MRNSLVHTDKSSPCMHSVWLGVDSGVPVRKQTRQAHMASCSICSLSGSPLVDTDKAPRACTRVWIGVDWGVPVRKLTRHHVRFLLKVDFGLPRANFSTQDDLDLEVSRTSRKQTRHHAACVAREGILLWILAKLPVHAPCLDWSRFGRSGQKAKHGIM